MTGTFIPPTWAMGNGDNFVLTASGVAGRNGPWACPGNIALEARRKGGTLQPKDNSRWQPTWDKSEQLFFALRDGLDALQRGDAVPDAAAINTNLTVAQRRFVTHALQELEELDELVAEAVGLRLEYQQGSTDFYRRGWGQIKLTGPEYANDDDSVREAVRLAYKPFREPLPAHLLDFAAVAAMALASDRPERTRIRVSEFSLADGDYRTLFDGTPAQAKDLYGSRTDPERGHLVAQALSGVGVEGHALAPGSACGSCWFLQVCPGPQRLPSALGIDKAVATRALSSTDLSLYDECPTKFHSQRRSHLPTRYAEGGETEDFTPRNRGVATHEFLRWAHSREAHSNCTEADLPDPSTQPDEVATLLAETGSDAAAYALARPYLLGHVQHCIVGFDGLTDVTVEPRHVIYDEYADVVLSVEPDVTLRSGPTSHIWRETKTRGFAPPRDEFEALNAYPAFAVHVTLLAAGAGGNGRDDGAAELEVLTPNAEDSRLYVVPMSDGALVAHAQKLVASIAIRWAQDLTFAPKPSSACTRCPMHGWCDPPPVAAVAHREPDDREFLGVEDPF